MEVYKLEFILWILVICQPRVYSESATDVENLLTLIFDTNNYDYRIRPVTDQTKATTVTVDFILTSIIDFDAQNELLKTSGYLSCTWHDDFITWSPGSFGGLENLFVPQNSIWRPDLSLRNAYERHRDSGLGSPFLNVRIADDGLVTWEPLEIFQSTCDIDITYYPFDVQECTLKFTVWSYRQSEVRMVLGTVGVRLNNYDTNSVWDLVGTESKALTSDETAVAFTLTLKRKASFYLITLISPIILLTVLNAAAFILPVQSGERASYVITVFLSLVVFLSIYAAEIPENSDTVSILAFYILLMSAFSTLMAIVSLIELRLIQRTNAPSPMPVGRFFRGIFWISEAVRCRICRKRKVTDTSKEDFENSTNGHVTNDVTWFNVVDAIDFIFFWIAVLYTLITTLIFGSIAYSYSSQFSALTISDEDRFDHNI